VGQGEYSFIALGSANLYNQFGNQFGDFLRKLKIVLSQDLAIPLLGIYPKDVPPYYKDTYSTMLTVALLIIARNWKQL
jgi:hypothetical protein